MRASQMSTKIFIDEKLDATTGKRMKFNDTYPWTQRPTQFFRGNTKVIGFVSFTLWTSQMGLEILQF